MTEIERLKDKLRKANDNYHDAVDDVLLSDSLFVEHKCDIGVKVATIFSLMSEILAYPLKEKE